MSKKIEIRISGIGGQGLIFTTHILGKAAVYQGKKVVQKGDYGAEARGSATKSEIIISEEKIGFPAIRECDILVAMSSEAVNKHLKDLKKWGILLVDTTAFEGVPETRVKVFKIPAIKTAKKIFKDKIYANMIMLGALTGIAGIVNEASIKRAIRESSPQDKVETNITAYQKGYTLKK